jgi:hypothetical protein
MTSSMAIVRGIVRRMGVSTTVVAAGFFLSGISTRGAVTVISTFVSAWDVCFVLASWPELPPVAALAGVLFSWGEEKAKDAPRRTIKERIRTNVSTGKRRTDLDMGTPPYLY